MPANDENVDGVAGNSKQGLIDARVGQIGVHRDIVWNAAHSGIEGVAHVLPRLPTPLRSDTVHIRSSPWRPERASPNREQRRAAPPGLRHRDTQGLKTGDAHRNPDDNPTLPSSFRRRT